jgi:hypothetical protein
VTSKQEEKLSPFARAIKDRFDARECVEFDVTDFFGVADKPMPKLAIRIPSKGEQDVALARAHEYAAKKACGIKGADVDPDLLRDAKLAAIAFEFARDASDPKYPAFPGMTWLCDHVEPDRIAILVNLANEVRLRKSASPSTLTDAMVQVLAEQCAVLQDGDYAESILAPYPHELLAEAFVMLAKNWNKLRGDEGDGGSVGGQGAPAGGAEDIREDAKGDEAHS